MARIIVTADPSAQGAGSVLLDESVYSTTLQKPTRASARVGLDRAASAQD
jgi:hypothetical protein